MIAGKAPILLAAAILLSACAGTHQPAPEALPDLQSQLEAQKLVSHLTNLNANLETFKGIGKIKVSQGSKNQVTRLAWIGARPARLRIELLAVTGQPIASLATDGNWIYAKSLNPKRFQKKPLNKDSLEQFIAVPVSSQDAVGLLSGRAVLPDYRYAQITAEDLQKVLVLSDHRGRILEKIYVDPGNGLIQKIERYDESGTLSYLARLEDYELVDHFQIPFRLILSNDDNQVQLIIDRYWSNTSISNVMFILNPS